MLLVDGVLEMDRRHPQTCRKLELDVSFALENVNDTAKSIVQQMGPNDVNMGLGFCMYPSGTHTPEIDCR